MSHAAQRRTPSSTAQPRQESCASSFPFEAEVGVAAGALELEGDGALGEDFAVALEAPPSAAAFLSAGVCPENFLVGENSPNLCPTISSEIVIGINDLPLCIKKL